MGEMIKDELFIDPVSFYYVRRSKRFFVLNIWLGTSDTRCAAQHPDADEVGDDDEGSDDDEFGDDDDDEGDEGDEGDGEGEDEGEEDFGDDDGDDEE